MPARLIPPILACLWLVTAAQAQSIPAPSCVAETDPLGCQQAGENLSPEMLGLLTLYPSGGQGLEATAYRIAVAQPERAFELIALANRAGSEPMAAIAHGLLRAFDELSEASPQCRASCADRLQQVALLRDLRRAAAPRPAQQKCTPGTEPAVKPYPQTCGRPVRAAMQCANETLAALLTALARQLYASVATAAGGPRGCFAPVYQSPHNAAGWTSSVPPADLPISRN